MRLLTLVWLVLGPMRYPRLLFKDQVVDVGGSTAYALLPLATTPPYALFLCMHTGHALPFSWLTSGEARCLDGVYSVLEVNNRL